MKGLYVGSNHFEFGKPAGKYNYPTKFLTPADMQTQRSPRKRPLPGTALHLSPRKNCEVMFGEDTFMPVAQNEGDVNQPNEVPPQS